MYQKEAIVKLCEHCETENVAKAPSFTLTDNNLQMKSFN